MSIRRMRQELAALREELTRPDTAREPSALDEINARLDRLRQRMIAEPGYVPPSPEEEAAARERLDAYFRQKFGMRLSV